MSRFSTVERLEAERRTGEKPAYSTRGESGEAARAYREATSPESIALRDKLLLANPRPREKTDNGKGFKNLTHKQSSLSDLRAAIRRDAADNT